MYVCMGVGSPIGRKIVKSPTPSFKRLNAWNLGLDELLVIQFCLQLLPSLPALCPTPTPSFRPHIDFSSIPVPGIPISVPLTILFKSTSQYWRWDEPLFSCWTIERWRGKTTEGRGRKRSMAEKVCISYLKLKVICVCGGRFCFVFMLYW